MAVRRVGTTEYLYVVIGKQLDVINEQICNHAGISSKLFSFIVTETNITVSMKLDTIKSKCFHIPYAPNKMCIIHLVNVIETD